MNRTGEYLDRFARLTADTIECTVAARNDDQTCMVERIDTKALLRASKSNPLDEFAIGSRVTVMLLGASRNSIGAPPVIVSRAPREQRGLSGTTPDETARSFSAAVIVSVSPDPLILVVGGEPGTQIIRGFGLSGPATYAGDDGATSPDLAEAEPQTLSATSVVVKIAADPTSLLGDWNVTVGGVTAEDALRVIVAPGPLPSIWALSYDLSSAPVLLRIDPATMEVFRAYPLDTPYYCDLLRYEGVIVVRGGRGFAGEGFGVLIVDRITGDVLSEIAQGPQSFTPLGMTAANGHALYPYNAPGLGATDLATGEETLTPLDFSVHGSLFVTVADGATLWATSGFGDGNRLVKMALEDASVIALAPFTETFELAVAPTAVFILRDVFEGESFVRELTKIDKADLSVIASVPVVADGAFRKGDTQLIIANGYVYGSVRPAAGGGIIFRAPVADISALETIAVSDEPLGIAVRDTLMYVGDSAGGITIVSLDTFTVFSRYPYDAIEVNRIVCA